jgi:hypothetical protein
MVKAFTPRKKKLVKVLDKRTKTVRIDANTLIEVSVSIPDEVARQRFFNRHQPPKPFWKRDQPLTVDEAVKDPVEVPLEAIEDIVNEEEAE